MIDRLRRTALFSYDFQQAQDGSAILVLAPIELKPTETREALERAKARLDRLSLYPGPVADRARARRRLRRGSSGCRGSTATAATRSGGRSCGPPGTGASDDLVTHELCHIWQGQHRRLAHALDVPDDRYRENPYELEARRAVAETRRR